MRGQVEADIFRVFAFAETLPFGVFGAVEDLADVARLVESGEALQVQQLRAKLRKEWCVRRGRDLRDLLQQLHIFRMLAEFVVSD